MKLRVRGNSIRLRLTQGEVRELLDHGAVEESTSFGAGAALRYAIALADDAPSLRASFDPRGDRGLRVIVPRAEAGAWAATERVGMEVEQPIGGGEVLRVLVEKDWACLAPRAGEDDRDAFANPNARC